MDSSKDDTATVQWQGLCFAPDTGDWLGWNLSGLIGSLITPRPGVPRPGWDVQVSGKWVFAEQNTAYTLVSYDVPDSGSAAPLCLTYTVGTLSVTSRYFVPGVSSLSCLCYAHLEVSTLGSIEPVQIGGFRFHLPGITLYYADDCHVTVPGPWWPKTYVRPQTPLSNLRDRDIMFHGAPDTGFGLLTLTNPSAGVTLTAYLNTSTPQGSSGYHPSLRGDGEAITFTFHDERAQWLHAGETVSSARLCVRVQEGDVSNAIRRDYRNHLRRNLPFAANTPGWVRDAVILEVMPTYFKGGFREIADKLPFYAEVGFNCLYLMPHWPGDHSGYHPDDLYAVNPALGTPDDLRRLVKAAHDNEMRLLFDMVIHGWGPKSELPRQHPELFVRDDEGNCLKHPTWGSITSDWAAPAYRQYMCDLVRHDLREYGIDGYRVDAASFKGPNWNRSLPYPAYRSGSDSPALMREMIAALRDSKPDAVLLSEVFGPTFYAACNLAHDNQTEALTHFGEMLDRGEVTADDYRLHIAAVYDCLPPGANRVFFTRNHDTSWFYHFPGYTSRYFAFEAIHAFCGIPSVFAGDPGNGSNPDDEPATWEQYRRLFRLRTSHTAFSGGNLHLRDVTSDSQNVFVARWEADDETALLAVSLSENTETVTLTLPQDVDPASLRWQDALQDRPVAAAGSERQFTLTLLPYQAVVGTI